MLTALTEHPYVDPIFGRLPEIVLTHGEIRSAQWLQMGTWDALCGWSKSSLGSTLLIRVFLRHRPAIIHDPPTLPILGYLINTRKIGEAPRTGYLPITMGVESFHNASYEICMRITT